MGEVIKRVYDLYVITVDNGVKHLEAIKVKSEAIIAFNLIKEDSKMRAAFLDERQVFARGREASFNIMKWRKRNVGKARR